MSTRNYVESLLGSPFRGILASPPLIEGDAMILAGQRCQQCVVANLFPYIIGKRVNSEVIGIFLKNLV